MWVRGGGPWSTTAGVEEGRVCPCDPAAAPFQPGTRDTPGLMAADVQDARHLDGGASRVADLVQTLAP
ncbi:hypothetical protein GCM10009780_71580 [Actinomadura alba]